MSISSERPTPAPPSQPAPVDAVPVAGGPSASSTTAAAAPAHRADDKPAWLRVVWIGAGLLSLVLGFIGIFLPLLPTAPFVLLAAFCFARGSRRWEQWMLDHRHFGPIVRNWNEHRAIPRRAKQLATVMMTISSVSMWFIIKPPWNWMPGLCCALVAIWIWRFPD